MSAARPGRRLSPDVRREQLLDAAVRCFTTRGPDAVTFDVIAAEAGVSRSLLHNYFGDRNGLLSAVFLRCFEAIDAVVDEAFRGAASPVDRLEGVIDAYVSFATERTEQWRLLLLADRFDLTELHAARIQRIEEVARWFGGGVEGRTIASAMIGAVERATFQWLAEGAEPAERLTALLRGVLWHGLPAVLPDAGAASAARR